MAIDYEEHDDRILAFDEQDICRGVAWGPAVDGSGEWFLRFGRGGGSRVDGRDAALAALKARLDAADGES